MALQLEVAEAIRKVVRMTATVINSTGPVLAFVLLVVGVVASSSPA
jgi:hypothetical protein